MKIVRSLPLNYETNFSSFVANEKNFKIIFHIFLIVSILIITILASIKIQKLLFEYVFRFFIPFKLHYYITDFFQSFILEGKNSVSFSDYENVFTNYRRYIYGFLVLFSIENLRIISRCIYAKKKWDRFYLSYGIYENRDFKIAKKYLLSSLGNVMSFGVSLVIFCTAIGFAIFKELSHKFTFENNFMFEGVVFSLFFWLSFVLYFALHIYQRLHNYYRNFSKNNTLSQKQDSMIALKSLFWHYFLNWIMAAVVSLNMPIDLFIFFCVLKFIPWSMIWNRLSRSYLPYSEQMYFNRYVLLR